MEEQTQEQKYEEWMQKIRAASGLAEEKVEEKALEHPSPKVSGELHLINHKEENKEEKEIKQPFFNKDFILASVILLAGLIYRLYFIFFVSNPQNAGAGWYGDTYHHWQIGYLTDTVGLSHGFLRLWDLKGMEFFWGPFHPLLLTLIFNLIGSANIVILRILSVIFGLGCLILLFAITRRYWDKKVAFAILIFGSFFPISVFNDTTGMVDLIGIFFILLGIYYWPKLPVMTGIAFVLASMVRAEAWLFSFGLMVGIFLTKEDSNKKIVALLTWAFFMLLYMKYLLDYTSNPIYPVYWNFLANGLGAWAGYQTNLNALQSMVRPILMVLGIASAGGLVLIMAKRPKGFILYLLGFGNIFFITAFIGFSHYVAGWEWWFPIIRFFVFPYVFIILVIFVAISKIKLGNSSFWSVIFFFIVISITLISQLTWIPIIKEFNVTIPVWNTSVSWGKELGKYYTGGTLLFPESDPNFTYTAVMYAHVQGKNILGEMFDPYYYLGEDNVYSDWNKYKKDIKKWLVSNNVQYAVIRTDTTRYQKLIKREPQVFQKLGVLDGEVYVVWRVYPQNFK